MWHPLHRLGKHRIDTLTLGKSARENYSASVTRDFLGTSYLRHI
jgi:hypothetical protein